MNTDEILEKVKDFADHAHGDQMRKYTHERYIVHPVRVMNLCREYTQDIKVLCAALLHDVLEDTPFTREDIHSFLTEMLPPKDALKIVKLVEELSNIYIQKDYPHLNRTKRKELELVRIARISKDARTVKYADIIDNCKEIVEHNRDFAGRFLSECKSILQVIAGGDPELHERAFKTVNDALSRLHIPHAGHKR